MTIHSEIYDINGPSNQSSPVGVRLPTNKRYPGITGDNSLESLWRNCLAPRCRLITSETEKGLKGSVVTD